MSSPSRYERVTRRAMLKASLGTTAFVLVPGLACGNDDREVFAGATAEPVPTTTTTIPPTTTEPPAVETTLGEAAANGPAAITGEMVISFTYTQAAGGKNEPPYVAVWIEDAAGDLATTVALWYEQGRRGDRWLDHLSRWYGADLDRIAAGGRDDVATISSATRSPGAYAVVWDGAIAGVPAPAGDYFVCVEAVREEGPYSLIREPLTLTAEAALPEMVLPDEGELSAASVRIDV